MKNKALLLALSKLFNLDLKVIEAAAEKEDGDDSVIKDFTTKFTSYSADDLAKLIKNANEQYLEKADFEITKVPHALYSKIAGSVLEKKEKTLAKEHNVTEYKDLTDLLNKIVEAKAGKGLDETTKQQIETLKGTIKTLEQEKEAAITEERKKFDGELIGRDFNSALSLIPFDYDKDTLDKQKELFTSAANSKLTKEMKNGKIVFSRDGKALVDKLGEPIPALDVLKSFATEYGFKVKAEDTGGRGTGNSNDPSTPLKGKTFEEAAAAAGVKPNTDESDKLFSKWQAENPK